MNYQSEARAFARSAAERRNYVRVPFSQDVRVFGPAPSPPIPARTIDISLGGVGVYCTASFARGLNVDVIFRLQDGAKGVVEERIPGRVVSLAADDGGNRIGIEFVEPLHAERYPVLSRIVAQL